MIPSSITPILSYNVLLNFHSLSHQIMPVITFLGAGILAHPLYRHVKTLSPSSSKEIVPLLASSRDSGRRRSSPGRNRSRSRDRSRRARSRSRSRDKRSRSRERRSKSRERRREEYASSRARERERERERRDR